MNWYNDAFFKIHFDMHLPASIPAVGEGFDAELLAAQLADIGTQAVCFFAKSGGGYSHFPTEVHRMHPGLHRDLLGEALTAFHARGIKLIAYYHPPYAHWLAEERPDYVSLDASGNTLDQGDQPLLCIVGPYTDEIIIPHVEEIVRKYPVDGLFFDGGYVAWPCYCAACQAKYHDATGEDIPPVQAGPAWRRYRAWLLQQGVEWRVKVAGAAHRIRPEVLFGVNWAFTCRMPEEPPEYVDYLTADIMEPENSSLCSSYQLRHWLPYGVPFDTMNSRMLHWWSDWTAKSTNALRLELATVLANGGRTFVGDLQHNSGMPDPEVIKRIGAAFDSVKPLVPLMQDAKAVPYIAILHSATSHYARSESLFGDDTPIRGAHLALLEGGFYAHILDEALAPSRLQEYQALVLSEQVCLSEQTITVIEDFVANGGGLVIVGDTASRNTDGQETGGWAIEALTGLKRVGLTEHDRNYLSIEAEWQDRLLSPEDVGCPPLLAHGKAVLTELNGARKIAPLVAPDPGVQVASLAPGEDSGYPGIALNSFGKGTVAFVALPITTDFFSRGHHAFKYILSGLLQLVTPRKLIEIEAPATLEATLFRQGHRLIVHLVSYHCERGVRAPAVVDRIPPVNGVKLKIACEQPPTSVTLEPGGATLEFGYEDGIVTVTVPQMGIYASVVVAV